MNIDVCLYIVMVLMCFFSVLLTYKDYKEALASGNERRINKDKKDSKEAMAIFFVAIVCFILGVFVF